VKPDWGKEQLTAFSLRPPVVITAAFLLVVGLLTTFPPFLFTAD
jgi:hypothetical protein